MVLALAAAMAMMLVASVAPAMAADNNHNNDTFRFDRFFFGNGISQQNEQDVQSGDATQNIDVTGGGANSNQCVGVQGVTNTGNATNNTSVFQADDNFDNNNNNNNGRFIDNRFDNRRFDDG